VAAAAPAATLRNIVGQPGHVFCTTLQNVNRGRSVSLRVVIAEIVLERLDHHAELRVGRRMMPSWLSPGALIVLAAFGVVVVGILLRSCD
jgi:hypothetical protein